VTGQTGWSAGTYKTFTYAASAAHYRNVNEQGGVTISTYTQSNTVNDRESYGMDNLVGGSGSLIYAVQTNVWALKNDVGYRTVAPMLRSGGSNTDGTAVALSTSVSLASEIYSKNPATATAWTDSTVNALEVGVVIKA
jgi:hypothetical protein